MPLTGTLRTWYDDKGFGFIAPSHGGREVFVHISAFPRDGSRPTIGERLVYELGHGKDGKPQAMRVMREALATSRTAPRPAPRLTRSPRKRRTGAWLAILLLVAGAAQFYRSTHKVVQQAEEALLAPAAPRDTPRPAEPVAPAFRCDGRTHCSQMTSCAEAKYFLKNCPNTQMDGNHDGVPCERQWCTSPLAK